ncbi:Uncharacterised protein [Campylobacter geochelonis]|uniref:Uncharacterized protein n=1 Tax=Campylobacter geochelonis TaxID=1780362 RepID=A0A128ECA9_9BACT|nr:Uncharacterised protein [Campylobacter geochelonis]CZE46636.1 Uncharacterised protein [Campylobacter geochelonis]
MNLNKFNSLYELNQNKNMLKLSKKRVVFVNITFHFFL